MASDITVYVLEGCPYCEAVPVLVDDERGVTMAESENILEYVDRTLA